MDNALPLFVLLGHILTERNVTLAGITLMIYDHFLTFDDEVRIIWKNRFTGVTGIFLLNRYFSLGGYLAVMYTKFAHSNATSVCPRMATFVAVLALVNQTFIVVTLVLRTYALYHRSRLVLFLTALAGTYTITQLFYAVFHMKGDTTLGFLGIPADDIGGMIFCVSEDQQVFSASSTDEFQAYILSITSIILFDLLIFALTLGRTLYMLKTQPDLRAVSPLHRLLMRDGTMYFFVMAFTNLLSFSYVLTRTDFRLLEISLGSNSVLGSLLSVVLLSRLILNLRSENERACRGSLVTVPLSTLSFPTHSLVAPKILGNLTAEIRYDSEDRRSEQNPDRTYYVSDHSALTQGRSVRGDQRLGEDGHIMLNYNNYSG